ncbi:stage IV sporulation protein FA [Anoxybacillus vitaminiphilus]|uniref:Stage IV sporulation protein FA n=1 Tax=Paranoxybacillus vitaminiphilus TaxID=581036 RepID=A0A327YKC1_9BACL|nr:M23 family metallopeptidase [Anoxybacillus vitaminiphilus]RAK21393.1 stage IV sporulation protein FA [Anoxybacillus vitaminiphilus]
MGNRADEIRKRIAKRKRQRQQIHYQQQRHAFFELADEEKYGGHSLITYDDYSNKDSHPLFHKELFLLKTFLSVCLVLITAILFKNSSSHLEPIRSFVKSTMEQEFQFAAVADWYEQQFGKPLALLPKEGQQERNKGVQYAVPAFGRVLESFDVNGQGVMVETGMEASVEAMNEGIVVFAGIKDKLGKTVIIQHADGTESWYGSLGKISVKLYDFVEMKKEVGKAMNNEDNTKGVFYFAIKQGEQFIDPIQVISFE